MESPRAGLQRFQSWLQRQSKDPEGQVLLALGTLGGLTGLLDELYLKNHLVERQFYIKSEMSIAAVGHQAGTCRFGTDPATSVLDIHCKAHELDNLYVVDTSFMPTIGAVNPSLTAIANALRVGDHLLERFAR